MCDVYINTYFALCADEHFNIIIKCTYGYGDS